MAATLTCSVLQDLDGGGLRLRAEQRLQQEQEWNYKHLRKKLKTVRLTLKLFHSSRVPIEPPNQLISAK